MVRALVLLLMAYGAFWHELPVTGALLLVFALDEWSDAFT